jgi:hypothetical protein
MDVTAVLSGQIAIGGVLPKDNGAHIIYHESGTPGGVGVYNVNTDGGTIAPGTALSETYGILTIGAVTSGTVAVGQEVTGSGIIGDPQSNPILAAAAAAVLGSLTRSRPSPHKP